MTRIYLFSFTIILLVAFGCRSKYTFDVTDYGVVADGNTLNTTAIQKLIDEVAAKGGGKIIFPKGKYLIGTVLVKSNVELHLVEGTEILGSTDIDDYYNIDPFIDGVNQKRGCCLIGCKDANNVKITGKGTINGRGERIVYRNKDDRSKRPFLMRIVRSNNALVAGITTRNSAAWNIHINQSSTVRVENVRILSQSESNGDGIDIDSSSDVTITGCDINAHDDAICLKATSSIPSRNIKIDNCRVSSNWGAFKFGTESLGGFENVEISNCYVYDTNGGGIKILSVDGGDIRNIHIHDIEMNSVEMPIFIRLGSRLRKYRGTLAITPGTIDGITIENIKFHGKRSKKWRVSPPSLIFITGIPDAKIKNVKIANIDAITYSNGTAKDAQKEVPEKEKSYPEFIKFDGHLPAFGAFI